MPKISLRALLPFVVMEQGCDDIMFVDLNGRRVYGLTGRVSAEFESRVLEALGIPEINIPVEEIYGTLERAKEMKYSGESHVG